MNDLVDSQKDRAMKIQSSWINFKKKGQAKMHKGATLAQLERLENLWKDFDREHDEILAADDYDHKHEYIKEDVYDKVEDLFLEVKGDFLQHLESFNPPPPVLNQHQPQQQQYATSAEMIQANVQKLPLPSFSGDYKAWSAFKVKFDSLVGSKNIYSGTTKLHYLLSCLTDQPFELIKHVPPGDTQFDVAWKKLTDHYDNIRRTTSLYLAALFKLDNMKSETSSEINKIILGVNGPLMALSALGRPTEKWDEVIVHLITSKIDNHTLKEWEISLGGTTDPPPLAQLIKFLESKASALEVVEANKKSNATSASAPKNFDKTKDSKNYHLAETSHTDQERKCHFCEKPHQLYQCFKFKKKSVKFRHAFARENQLCSNCLSEHAIENCPSTVRCQKCDDKHHTLLHSGSRPMEDVGNPIAASSASEKADTFHSSNHLLESALVAPEAVLLSTALVKSCGPHGHESVTRTLIDQCSQSNFISEYLCQKLKLRKKPVSIPITGLNSSRIVECKSTVELIIKPHFNSVFSCHVEANVVPKISCYQPKTGGKESTWQHLLGLQLADPHYHQASRVDLLLGAAVHALIVEGQVIKGSTHEPIATETALGWLVSGSTSATSPGTRVQVPTVLHCAAETEVYDLLQKFWVREEKPPVTVLTPDEQKCEEHFMTTHMRDDDGTYSVRLPFKRSELPSFSDTFTTSLKMLNRMEKKFRSDPVLKQTYHAFMREYLELGHMMPLFEIGNENLLSSMSGCFLPHHSVYKETSTTTKLRVVFNGSSQTKDGISLNDCLLIGANFLPDIVLLLLKWRKYKYAFVADVEKMFRQIKIHEDDQIFQLILWRFDESQPVVVYKCLTVTYGIASSPFDANRVRIQLASDEQLRFPRGAEILSDETYMDDVTSGGHSKKQARDKVNEVTQLCKVGGFTLRKWVSNEPSILSDLPASLHANQLTRDVGEDTSFAILGLQWQPRNDDLIFRSEHDSDVSKWTRRLVLSKIAKLYDPLGLVSPAIVTAKIFLQRLWILKMVDNNKNEQRLGWDEPLPHELTEDWMKWYDQLPCLSAVKIPRWLGFVPNSASLQIHGFADASKFAYGYVIYLRTVDASQISVKLISSKSRVAPLKSTSIPRLELSAAVELARGIANVLPAFETEKLEIFCWVDAKDVLYWLREIPSRWPTYVANRCALIHDLLPKALWLHVRTAENPADFVSRGVSPADLPQLEEWWNGPGWLSHVQSSWPRTLMEVSQPEFVTVEVNKSSAHLTTVAARNRNLHESELSHTQPLWNLLYRNSTLAQILGSTAYVLRMIDKVLQPGVNHPIISLFAQKWYQIGWTSVTLSVAEWKRARTVWIFLVQHLHFAQEIKALELGREVSKASPLLKLNPVLINGVLHSNTRLKNSLLPERQRLPILLPFDGRFTELLVRECHQRTLHGGVQLTLSTLRNEFWIIKGRQCVKLIINKCVPCLRYRATQQHQLMASLPPVRVRPSRPFSHAGVDYASPFLIKTAPGRGHTASKGYICLFICPCTRAVHLEAASDYSTKTFLAAFDRFVARRGAAAELKQRLKEDSQSTEISEALAQRGTDWQFNPPAAPHFGGLWEAAVKSTKHHLHRVIGEFKPTFEEFSTLLCRIEACLNSRPIAPMSDDPDDLRTLTPAHFLIQSDSFLTPEPDYCQDKVPATKRWRIMQQMSQHFWRRWTKDYLVALAQRSKWPQKSRPAAVGDMVLIRNENTPPAQWPLARITAVHVGSDNLPRVVTVRTAHTELDRPITKIVLLLADENSDNNANVTAE